MNKEPAAPALLGSTPFVERGSSGMQWVAIFAIAAAATVYTALTGTPDDRLGVFIAALTALICLPLALGYLLRKPLIVRSNGIEVNHQLYTFDTLSGIVVIIAELPTAIGLRPLRVRIELLNAGKECVAAFSSEHWNRPEIARFADVIAAVRPSLEIVSRSE